MALSPKERESIVEEETLRFETRRNLHSQKPGCRRRIWPWCLAFFILGYAAHGLCSRFCGSSAYCPYEMGAAHGHCLFGGDMAPDQGPGNGAPAAPAAPAAPSK